MDEAVAEHNELRVRRFLRRGFRRDPLKDFRRERLENGTEVDVLPGSRTPRTARDSQACTPYDHPIDMRIVYYERDLAHVT